MSQIAFLFPGQGAQTVGMGQKLAESVPAAGELFERAKDVLGYDLLDICTNGPAEKLNSTVYSQPGLFVTSLAAVESVRAETPGLIDDCYVTAGLSLGEYTSMVFAGAMDFETGLKVVKRRGEAMQAAADAVESGMVSVLGMEIEQVEELCEIARGQGEAGEILQIANYLCPGNIACSGHKAACERLDRIATEAGAMKVISLAVAGAFHTPLMQPAVEQLREVLADADIRDPRIPIVSNVDAQPHTSGEEMREILVRQVVSPVLWEDSMRKLESDGVNQMFELGPGKVLRGIMKRINRKLPVENVIG